MKFVHEDSEFADLLRIVAASRGLTVSLVEKDYWVTHTLWARHTQGFEVWFKGGTSLSKGFGLIRRFSEDLDLKVGPGSTGIVAGELNWRSEGVRATAARREFFEALAKTLRVPGAHVILDSDIDDSTWRNARLQVRYPQAEPTARADWMRPFVLLEIGDARVTPFVSRDLGSHVHDELERLGWLGAYTENRPRDVRCIHPLVTLIEKLDALQRRVSIEENEPATFVRHFEDAALIIEAEAKLPALADHADCRALAEDMLARHQIRALPESHDPAFALPRGPRTDSIRRASDAIAPMFWGARMTLDDACVAIRGWIAKRFE
jgi:hypothetical protein